MKSAEDGGGWRYSLPSVRLMTPVDSKDLVTAREKLEWITPKILLLEIEETEGRKLLNNPRERTIGPIRSGPS